MKEARTVINSLFGEIQHTVLSVLDQYRDEIKKLNEEKNALLKELNELKNKG